MTSSAKKRRVSPKTKGRKRIGASGPVSQFAKNAIRARLTGYLANPNFEDEVMDLVTLHIAKRPDLFEKRDDGSYELEVDNLSSTALRFLQSAMDEVFGAPEGVEENQSATRPRSHSTDHGNRSPSTLPSSSKLAP